VRARTILIAGAIVLAVVAAALWHMPPDAPPPRRVIGFVAETAGVSRGDAVRLGGQVIGRVAAAARADSRLRLELVLHEDAPPLVHGGQLRFVRGPTGLDWHVEVLLGERTGRPLGPGDVLAAAPSVDEADSTRHALEAVPELARGAQDAIRFLKRHPSLWSDSAR
jgi:hypothetical protein